MKIFKKTIFTIFTVFIVLLLAYNIYNFVCIRILKKDISTVGGYGMLEVVSGSMEPTIKVGDIIVIDVEDKDYKIGDIITFSKDNSFVTHRIISLDGDYLTTKGDNINNTEDDPISLNQILGIYKFKIRGGGKFLSAIKNPFTMIMIFIIGILVCVFVSTDKDGKAIVESEEKEYQEFQKYLKSKKKARKKKSSKLDE